MMKIEFIETKRCKIQSLKNVIHGKSVEQNMVTNTIYYAYKSYLL